MKYNVYTIVGDFVFNGGTKYPVIVFQTNNKKTAKEFIKQYDDDPAPLYLSESDELPVDDKPIYILRGHFNSFYDYDYHHEFREHHDDIVYMLHSSSHDGFGEGRDAERFVDHQIWSAYLDILGYNDEIKGYAWTERQDIHYAFVNLSVPLDKGFLELLKAIEMDNDYAIWADGRIPFFEEWVANNQDKHDTELFETVVRLCNSNDWVSEIRDEEFEESASREYVYYIEDEFPEWNFGDFYSFVRDVEDGVYGYEGYSLIMHMKEISNYFDAKAFLNWMEKNILV